MPLEGHFSTHQRWEPLVQASLRVTLEQSGINHRGKVRLLRTSSADKYVQPVCVHAFIQPEIQETFGV